MRLCVYVLVRAPPRPPAGATTHLAPRPKNPPPPTQRPSQTPTVLRESARLPAALVCVCTRASARPSVRNRTRVPSPPKAEGSGTESVEKKMIARPEAARKWPRNWRKAIRQIWNQNFPGPPNPADFGSDLRPTPARFLFRADRLSAYHVRKRG